MNNSQQDCTLFNGDEKKCNTIIIIKRVVGTLSLVGCLFVIGTIWLFRKYNVKSQKLILYLSIAAFFDTIAYMVGDMTPDGPICDFEAWCLTYFDWSVLMWTSCITFDLYRLLTKNYQTNHLYFHIAGWICPPLLLSLLPLIGDNYGPAGAWCWIKHDSVAWRFTIWYVPLILILIAIAVLWGRTIYLHKRAIPSWQGGAHEHNSELVRNMIEEDMKTLQWYPLIYLSVSLFPFILRIHNAATAEGEDIFWLWIMTVLTAPLQGACNAIIFGFDPETRAKLSVRQIKMAFSSHFETKPTIQEYHVEENTEVQEHDETTPIEAVPYGSIDNASSIPT